MKHELLLVGGGGHCRSVIDVIEQEGKYSIAGIVDNDLNVGEKIIDYEIIGKDEALKDFRKKYDFAFITVGQINSSIIRIRLYSILLKLGFTLPIIISPRAYVANSATIGEGTIVMHDALINASAKIGENCIINTKALIEHDVHIGKHSHISTSAVINGGVIIGDNSFIGSNAVTNNNISIHKDGFVKAGSLLK